MDRKRFPIVDIQFHEEGIREAAAEGGCTREEEILAVAWHTTAITYLEAGAALGLPGPASIDADGRVFLVEDYLEPKTDSHGQPYFVHVEKPLPAMAG